MRSKRAVFEKSLKMALDNMELMFDEGGDHGDVVQFKFDLEVTLADGKGIRIVPRGSFAPSEKGPPVTPGDRFERKDVL